MEVSVLLQRNGALVNRWGMTGDARQPLLAEAVAGLTFERYVEQNLDLLVRTACLITRDWAEAQDAVQDALANVWSRWESLPVGRAEAYVHRSVVNACLMRLRRLRRVRPVAEPSMLRAAPTTGDPADRLTLADQAWRLCEELPPVQRAAVVLRFYRDLSYAEIGEALDCAEATARSHVHRALGSLRREWEAGEQHG